MSVMPAGANCMPAGGDTAGGSGVAARLMIRVRLMMRLRDLTDFFFTANAPMLERRERVSGSALFVSGTRVREQSVGRLAGHAHGGPLTPIINQIKKGRFFR